MKGKGGDKTALTLSESTDAIWAAEGKNARKFPSTPERSASLWHIRSAPCTPPRRPVLMILMAIRRTYNFQNKKVLGFFKRSILNSKILYVPHFVELMESGRLRPRRRLPSWLLLRRGGSRRVKAFNFLVLSFGSIRYGRRLLYPWGEPHCLNLGSKKMNTLE